MCHQSGPSLVEILACCLFGVTPLSKPVLDYCQLGPWENISVKSRSKCNFNWRKCFWKCQPLYLGLNVFSFQYLLPSCLTGVENFAHKKRHTKIHPSYFMHSGENKIPWKYLLVLFQQDNKGSFIHTWENNAVDVALFFKRYTTRFNFSAEIVPLTKMYIAVGKVVYVIRACGCCMFYS